MTFRKTQFESRRGKLNKYSSKLVKISILLFLIWKNIFHLLWYQNWNEENWQKDTWYKKVWHFSKNNKNVAFFWNTTYTLVTSSFPGRVCIYLICVLCKRHPFLNNGIFPNFIEQKTKKMHFRSKIKIWKKKKNSATMFRYFWTPMLTKSKSVHPIIDSDYIQT